MTQEINIIPARTIGIDLGDLRSNFCVLDASGATVDEGVVGTNRDSLRLRFRDGAGARAIIEASCQSGWVGRQLEECGFEVVVANPRQVHLISKSDRKSDRNDARLLARLGRVDPGLLRPVTPRSEANSAVQALLRARSGLIQIRTKLVNTVRAEVKVLGGRLPACGTKVFHKIDRKCLPTLLRDALAPLFDTLSSLQENIDRYDAEVDRMCKEDFQATGVLRQIAGVGPLVALTYVVTLGDPRRFEDSRSIGSYLGLTPRSYQSGNRNPQLRISKRGDRYASGQPIWLMP